jgi:dTDP-4-amino-4,6-dideoxygalactose transaminase
MPNQPALLGGRPIFETHIQIVRPVLPAMSSLSGGIEDMLSTGMVTKGRYLRQFEEAVAQHLGVHNAVAVSSCTTGLMLTYKALGLTGEVVVPSFTFMATVSALVWNGLRPVFTDVRRTTTDLDPSAAEAAITPQTTAIVAVHNFGNPAEIDALEALARRRGLKLIFDAAHGFGALYQGKPVGSQGDAQVFSLSPTKLLIAGEGGIVATNDDELADCIRVGREYGNDGHYGSAFAGMNARMPEFNALLGLHSLEMLEDAAQTRNETAGLYQEALGNLPGIHFQEVLPGNRNAYKDYSISIDSQEFGLTRDELALALAAENIDTRKYHHPPVHRHKAYQMYADGAALPATEWLAASSISLPIWTDMDPKISLGICEAIQRIHENFTAVHQRLLEPA